MNFVRPYEKVIIGMFLLLVAGCASIPPEAPELSVELGNRINAIEQANLTLLHRFFDLKRENVDRFISEVWIPVFAEEIFSAPEMERAWNTIVSENNPADRLRFLLTVSPRLQQRINQKRTELIQPLEEIERRIEERIEGEYAQARAINNTITSFLFSASKISENRNRYMEMVGVTDQDVGNAIDSVDDAVNTLITTADTAEENAMKAERYLQKLQEIRNSLQ